MRRPRFQPHFRVEVLEQEGVFLLSEAPTMVLDGRLFRAVAPLLDGTHTVDEIVAKLAGTLDVARVHYALARLKDRGYIVDAEDSLSRGEQALWSSQKIEPADAASRLSSGRVVVSALGAAVDDAAKALDEALGSAGVRRGDPSAPWTADLRVVLVDDYRHTGLEAVNREALANDRAWMLVRPVGYELWVGPILRPGVTACWACLASRLLGNRSAEGYVRAKIGAPDSFPTAIARSATTVQAAISIAASEVAGWLARGRSSTLEGQLLSVDVRSWETRAHPIVKRPQCPSCGQASSRTPRPITLESRPFSALQDGGYRSVSAEETLRRYEHHVSPITGALLGLERVGPSNDGVSHVYSAGPNNARASHGSFEGLRFDLRNRNSGKGTNDANARASAVCEGLERHSGVYQGDEPRRVASLRMLGDDGIHPNACMLFSDAQYRDRDAWNQRDMHPYFVPYPFDPDAEIEWAPVWSLTRKAFRYLPLEYCYYLVPQQSRLPFCVPCSTGNAAGNNLEEAVLQGFFELVERDAVALFWYNRIRRPGVDLDHLDDPYVQKLRKVYATRGRDLWVLDVTSDLGIPVYAALSRHTDAPPERIMFGFGAHINPRIALLRAVTELNQMVAMFQPDIGAERGAEHRDMPPTVEWLLKATLASEPYLVPEGVAPLHVDRSFASGDLKDDLERCQAAVEREGLEMLVLDQTRADIGMPVVKVFVPGLRHFWARFAPGRLYDTPVRLGWLPAPLREDQLNPTAMFL